MKPNNKIESNYFKAGSTKEAKRLELQAKIFDELLLKEIDVLGLKPGVKVLDAGCGTGAITRMMAERVRPSKVHGVDFDSTFIKKAKTLASNQGLKNITFKVENLLDLSYGNRFFDVAYCRLVLAHNKNPVAVIKELKRVTREGGILAASEYDDGTIVYYPEMPNMKQIWVEYDLSEKAEGRDRFLGRKLFSIFSEAGLDQITIHLLPIYATQKNPEMLKIILMSNLSAFLNSDNHEKLISEVNSFLSHPGAFLMGVTFLVTGFVR